MSFRGRGSDRGFAGRGRGGDRGGRGRGGFSRGGSRGGYGGYNDGPPAEVQEIGKFVHAVEGEMLCASTNASKVPYFNAPMFLENKSGIGKVDEILGAINEMYFTIKMGEGMVANSFKEGDKVFIGGDKLLPIERFIPQPKVLGPKPVKKRGVGRGRGDRGAGRGRGMSGRGRGMGAGRGAPRGMSRGRGGPRGAPRARGGFAGRSRGRGY